MPIDLFKLHSRTWEANRYIYPVVSRRSKGLSIGINLNPDKACNFDCVYCSVDRTVPATIMEVDLDLLRNELAGMLEMARSGEIWAHPPFDRAPAHLKRINDVAFSGDGEPSSYPRFFEACELSACLLQRAGLQDSVKIVVITNATLLHRPDVSHALDYLDTRNGEIWAKLDAGSDDYYHLVERTKIPLRRVLDNILLAGRRRPIVIQSLFMKIYQEQPSDQEIDAYIGRLRELMDLGCQIKLVQVYTTARDTAETYVSPLPNETIDGIAQRVRELGLVAEAYHAPT